MCVYSGGGGGRQSGHTARPSKPIPLMEYQMGVEDGGKQAPPLEALRNPRPERRQAASQQPTAPIIFYKRIREILLPMMPLYIFVGLSLLI